MQELSIRELNFERQKELPLDYKGVKLDCGYRIDMIVEDCVIIEIKAIEKLLPVHTAQLLTYLRLMDKKVGLLINFHVPKLVDGIKRISN